MKRLSLSFPSRAFTLIELAVVIVTIGLLVGVVIPGMIQAKKKAQRIRCVSHLKQLGLSFRIWAGDHTNDLNPMSISTNLGGTMEYISTGDVFRHFQVMSNELSTPAILVCPSDRQHIPATSFSLPLGNTNLSYFAGLDANETTPQMLLAGDRNITGSVMQANGILTITTNDVVGWSQQMHGGAGNVALADGSVQQFSIPALRKAVEVSGIETNRLAIP